MSPVLLARRATHLRERMDDPDCSPRRLRRTYAQLWRVNSLVAGWGRIYRRLLRPRLDPGGRATLVDIGCGAGDIPVGLARRAARDGLQLEVTAIDPDPRAMAYVGWRHSEAPVRFLQASAGDLAAAGERFDFVVSNHLLHHLGARELARLLADSQSLSRVLALHNDIERADLPFLVFALSRPVFWGSYITVDGLASIRRSFTRRELERLAPPGWRVGGMVPYRNLLLYEAEKN